MSTTNPSELFRAVTTKVVGRRREVRNILAALNASRNVLLEGPPGTSKSTILREITSQTGVSLHMLEGSPELTPAKVIGSHNPARVLADGYSSDSFDDGPLTKAMREGGFLYIEEFNRIPEDVMNVLIRSMDERKIAIPRVGEIQARGSFRFVAAMNPFDDVGTERISRAITDRLCRLTLGYQAEPEETSITRLRTGSTREWLPMLAVRLVRRTRSHPDVKMGSSVRGAIDLVMVAEQLFQVEGLDDRGGTRADFVEHVRELTLEAALMALSSKIWVMETSEKTPEDVIREIYDEIWNELQSVALPAMPDGDPQPGNGSPMDEGGDMVPPGEGTPDDQQTPAKAEQSESASPELAQEMQVRLELTEAQAELTEHRKEGEAGMDREGIYLGLEEYGRPTKNRQDQDAKRTAKDLALSIALSIPRVNTVNNISSGEFKPCPYSFNSDELDVDRTVERIIERGKSGIDYEDLVVLERKRKNRAYSLVLDASGSMKGENIMRAAIAATTLVNNIRKDDYAIVAFSERAIALKIMNSMKMLRQIVDDIFDIDAGGLTDIVTGLDLGLRQLHLSRFKERIGIILTDGAHNKRGNPVDVARMYPRLNVIGIKPPWASAERTCEEMARAGRGKCIFIDDVKEIPRALTACLVGN